jgi:hypothetical protein
MLFHGRFEENQLENSTFEVQNELLGLSGFEISSEFNHLSLYISGNKQFHDTFESSVFLQQFEESASEALTHLKGGFVGVVWNSIEKEIILFADVFTIFPVYYSSNPYKALFSTSLKSLLQTNEIEQELDATSLLNYFRFDFTLPGQTLFRGIHQLEGGQYIRISEDHFSVNYYFEWNKRHHLNFPSVETVFETITNLSTKQENTIDKPASNEITYTNVTELVQNMDTPIWTSIACNPLQLGQGEVFGALQSFAELPQLVRKKWPMSFSPFLRNYIGKLGLWKWPGLTGKWRQERLKQEYWDLEFLYQFEHLKRSTEEIKPFFNWNDFPKNGLFEYLHSKIGYGTNGYQLPITGRLGVSELYTRLFCQQLPWLRFFYNKNFYQLNLDSLNKDLFSYALSVPDGLKEWGYADNIAKRFCPTLDSSNSCTISFPKLTDEDWVNFTNGMQLLPYCDVKKLYKEIRKAPENYFGILILGIWLNETVQKA